MIHQKAEDAGVTINVEQGDFVQVAPEDRQYDLVFSSGLLEEIGQEHHKEAIEGFMRWTKPGGLNIIKYCVWIKGRGELTRPGIAKEMYTMEGWNILFSEEPKEKIKKKDGVAYDESIQEEVLTETLVAIKPQ